MKKILIINPEGSFYTNPTLIAFYDALIISGYYVKILSPFNAVNFRSCDVLVYSKFVRKLKTLIIERVKYNFFDWIVGILNLLKIRKSYDLIVGVDRQGIIEASWLCKLFNSKKVFFSFEIMFEDETSLSYKRREAESCKGLSFWLAQDEVRAKCISIENSLEIKRGIIVPVAPQGKVTCSNKSLRIDLGIPSHKKVAIQIGSLSKLTMFDEILNSVSKWPPEWVLIIHDKDAGTEKKLKSALQSMGSDLTNRIYVSNAKFCDFSDMSYILNGVNVGLALYNATYESKYLGKNVKYIGASSGKISTYLKHGVPIVTNLIDWHAQMISSWKYGIVIRSIDELYGSLVEIGLNGRVMSINAQLFFKSFLDFELYRMEILDKVSGCLSC